MRRASLSVCPVHACAHSQATLCPPTLFNLPPCLPGLLFFFLDILNLSACFQKKRLPRSTCALQFGNFCPFIFHSFLMPSTGFCFCLRTAKKFPPWAINISGLEAWFLPIPAVWFWQLPCSVPPFSRQESGHGDDICLAQGCWGSAHLKKLEPCLASCRW